MELFDRTSEVLDLSAVPDVEMVEASLDASSNIEHDETLRKMRRVEVADEAKRRILNSINVQSLYGRLWQEKLRSKKAIAIEFDGRLVSKPSSEKQS